jgi:hypothetical protein
MMTLKRWTEVYLEVLSGFHITVGGRGFVFITDDL